MADAVVTVVVATYGRPDVLACALESARRQTLQDWTMLVVGDCCPSAGDVVAGLGDPRIAFVNLPARQGEQGPPNSVGMTLASTPFIALLNHDDVWLPDHLEGATAAIKSRSLDMYAGSAAFAHVVVDVPGGDRRPVFSERTPRRRSLGDVFSLAPWTFEPASSLVFTRDLAAAVGPWTPAAHTFRPSLHHWLLRVWRTAPTFFSDRRVTTLKVNTHNKVVEGRYARVADDQRALLAMLDAVGSDGLRAVIRSDLRHARGWGAPQRRNPAKMFPNSPEGSEWTARLRDPAAAQRFLDTGHDVFDDIATQRGHSPGGVLRQRLRRRTGEELREPDDLDALIASCRRQLESV